MKCELMTRACMGQRKHLGPRQESNKWDPETGRALYPLIYKNSWRASSFNWVHMWTYKNILTQLINLACYEWIERPPGVREVLRSIAVRDSDFFVPHSCHVDQFTFHSFHFVSYSQNRSSVPMLVKKGQNNKIINLHDKTVRYTSRFVYTHQDLYIYIKIRIYTSRFVYIQQDSYIYIKIRIYIIKICIYTSRFIYIHQDSYIYSKIRIYTSRFVYTHQDL